MNGYRLIQDDDGHWYVMPVGRSEEAEAYFADPDNVPQPDWLEPLGGSPTMVVFPSWRVL